VAQKILQKEAMKKLKNLAETGCVPCAPFAAGRL
jgi:hypothetical protein